MAFLYVLLSLSAALLMILILDASVDIKYERGLRLVLTVNILSVTFYKDKDKARSKEGTKGKSKNRRGDRPKRSVIIRSILELLHHSDITINRISIPDNYYENKILPAYQTESFIFTLISVFIAYLDTNTAKLLEKPNAYTKDNSALIVDISAKAPFYRVLKSILFIRHNATQRKRRKYV